ncbi:hypothetical protein ABEB36_009497 [Hypothenemus hampei]|uniref:Uncharacterized protein n=1 Tax=Hypothenemus hampei TaxID=57062 RepID=A0ABD1EGK6_HYPHA
MQSYFPEVGHSYLDSDRDFGRIEKALRKHQNTFTPDQYREIIRSASTKDSLCLNMENFFHNLEELSTILHLFKKMKNSLNEKVNLRDTVKWITVDTFGYYLYKTSLDAQTPFLQVDLHKKGAREIQAGEVVLNVLPKCGGLTVEKISNLREQLKFVNKDYRWFYEAILQEASLNPKQKK